MLCSVAWVLKLQFWLSAEIILIGFRGGLEWECRRVHKAVGLLGYLYQQSEKYE